MRKIIQKIECLINNTKSGPLLMRSNVISLKLFFSMSTNFNLKFFTFNLII